MKLIACGDIHITDKMPYSSKESDRSDQLLNAWGQMINKANEEEIKIIIITGDTFDDINVSPRAFEIFTLMLTMAQGKEIIIIAGNHECDEEGNAIVKQMGNFISTGIVSVEPGMKYSVIRADKDHDFLLFDYHHSHYELNVSIRKALRESGMPYKIFVGHQPIEGMEMRDSVLCTHGIPKKWFKKNGLIGKNFSLVLMGDFHRPQSLKGDIEGYYTGSLIQHSFKDEKGESSFLVVDTEEGTVEAIPIDAPKFHTLRFIEGKKRPDPKALTKGGYIKIIMIGTQEYIDSIDIKEVTEKIVDEYKPIKLLVSNPTITDSIPSVSEVSVSRLMNDEELVEKIISNDQGSTLPDKLRYDTGIKYLRRVRE